MNTFKMIAEIKQTCAALEKEKKELSARIAFLDDRLAAYHMAAESLEMTLPETKEETTAAEPVPPKTSDIKYTNSTLVEFNGQKRKCSEWSKQLGLSRCAVSSRLNSGWTVEDALTKGRENGGHKKGAPPARKVFVYDSHDNVLRQYASIVAAARDMKLPEATIRSNIINTTRQDQLNSRGYYLAYAK